METNPLLESDAENQHWFWLCQNSKQCHPAMLWLVQSGSRLNFNYEDRSHLNDECACVYCICCLLCLGGVDNVSVKSPLKSKYCSIQRVQITVQSGHQTTLNHFLQHMIEQQMLKWTVRDGSWTYSTWLEGVVDNRAWLNHHVTSYATSVSDAQNGDQL